MAMFTSELDCNIAETRGKGWIAYTYGQPRKYKMITENYYLHVCFRKMLVNKVCNHFF